LHRTALPPSLKCQPARTSVCGRSTARTDVNRVLIKSNALLWSSFPRKRESSKRLIRLRRNFWTPAFAGATKCLSTAVKSVRDDSASPMVRPPARPPLRTRTVLSELLRASTVVNASV